LYVYCQLITASLCLPIMHILQSLVMSCNLCYGYTAITSYRDRRN